MSDKELMKINELSEEIAIRPYERSVYYYETDRMGIVHHSNYIRWFEEARVDFLNQIGYPCSQIEEEGIMMPVLSVSSTYKKVFQLQLFLNWCDICLTNLHNLHIEFLSSIGLT